MALPCKGNHPVKLLRNQVTLKPADRVDIPLYINMLIQKTWPVNRLVLQAGTWVGTQRTNSITLRNLVEVWHSAFSTSAMILLPATAQNFTLLCSYMDGPQYSKCANYDTTPWNYILIKLNCPLKMYCLPPFKTVKRRMLSLNHTKLGHVLRPACSAKTTYTGVPGGSVNILVDHSIGHSKQKSVNVHVSYSKRFPR